MNLDGGRQIDQAVYPSKQSSEESLVNAAQNGCQQAYAELMRRHHGLAYRVVNNITKNLFDTEDVLQDMWLSAFLHIEKFDRRSRFSTWLTRIAINSALMTLRKQRRHLCLSLDHRDQIDGTYIPEPVSTDECPEQILLLAERKHLLSRAINRLPDKLRMTTTLRQIQDGSLQEVSLKAGISICATKSRLRRARLLLEPKLKPLENRRSNRSANSRPGASNHNVNSQNLPHSDV